MACGTPPAELWLDTDCHAFPLAKQAMADEAQADLDEALPALEAALDSLKALNKVSPSVQVVYVGSGHTLHPESGPKPTKLLQDSAQSNGGLHLHITTTPARHHLQNDIVEIKSFPKPPPLVQMTLEAVCILKQEKPDWDTVRV